MLSRQFANARRYPFPAVPNGWFALALSSELAPGQMMPLDCLGQRLVLFRGEDGQAHVFDAYCPHLGADMGSGGKVVGNTLQCPFHHWCFDGTGACVKAPNVGKIPPTARTVPWPVHETDGVIFTFHHTERQAPTWWPVTRLDPAWTPLESKKWRSRCHAQEVIENTVDSLHAPIVHGYLRPTVISNAHAEGPMWKVSWDMLLSSEYAMSQAPGLEVNTDGDIEPVGGPCGSTEDPLKLKLDITAYGLGFIDLFSILEVLGWPALVRVCLTPIDENETQFHIITSVLAPPGTDPELACAVNRSMNNMISHDTKQDCYIFERKAYLTKPVLAAEDGPIMQVRRWARQFYTAAGHTQDESSVQR